ncbi:MAG: response regulator [Desulfobacteraceae bacterium]|jgi:two-component system OmpR family response regulator|nr:response regulator [Desulfobacteraceae bacterium]
MEILVVMPDHKAAENIQQRISEHGHHVMLAGTIKDAKAISSCQQFDLSFIHLCLPDGDGLELIKHMKKCFPEIRIVAMTDSNSRLQELSARKLGIIYYMVEPFEARETGYIADHLSRKVSNF